MPDTNRIQVNVPLSEDEKKMIQEAAKQHGLSQAEFLRQAARNAVMDDLAEAVPEQGDAIAEYRAMHEISSYHIIFLQFFEKGEIKGRLRIAIEISP